MIAGAEEFAYPRFFLYDFIGEAMWAVIPLALGYIFGANWEAEHSTRTPRDLPP